MQVLLLLPTTTIINIIAAYTNVTTGDIRKSIIDLNKKIRGLLGDDILSSSVPDSMMIVSSNISIYIKWLRTHQLQLSRECRNEEIVTSVNASVRAW